MRRVVVLVVSSLLVGAGLFASPSSAETEPAGGAEPAAVPDQLLVGYRPGAAAGERSQARSAAGARLLETVYRGDARDGVVELVGLSRGSDRSQAERRFESNPNVEYAEPNWVLTHDATSNDPYYENGSLWGMYGDSSPLRTNQYGSQAGEAWTSGNTGSNTVYVGVIDEGIQITHPDLDANRFVNPGEVAGNGVDDDGNGYVDDVNGWDFHGNNNSVYDGTGDDHGTHVAGTIGAEGGNDVGVVGMAWNVKMIPAKFLGPNGGSTSNAIKAVRYITDLETRHGLDIVATNNSWGGGGYSQGLLDAINAGGSRGILFVAAAGNSGVNTDSSPHYPSSYNSDYIISVAAIASNGSKPSWSNYGKTSVDLGAPGSGIWSTVPSNTYNSYGGTSMATPHVSGAVALYAAVNPGASASDIKSAILSSTVPTSSMSQTVTGGRLNVSGFTGSGGGDEEPPVTTPTMTVTLARSASSQGSTWTAVVTVQVREADADPVPGAAIAYSWSRGLGSGTCTTGTDGNCVLTRSGISNRTKSVSFTVTSASEGGHTLAGSLPSITVNKP